MPVLIKGSGKIPKLQPKEVPSYTEKIIYTPDEGYDGFSEVTVNAIPKAAQATPSITINQSGLITASATQSEGYVSAGTKGATNQMTTQNGKDVYPGTTRQLVVPAWRYTIGNIYVNGDSNLTAGNIKKGVSIFGVAGSYEGSGGEMQSKSATPTSASRITMSGLGDVKNFVLLVNDIDVDVSGGATISSICYSNGKLIGLQTIYTLGSGNTAVIATTGYSTYLSVTISSGTLTITALQTDNACFDTGSSYILYYN